MCLSVMYHIAALYWNITVVRSALRAQAAASCIVVVDPCRGCELEVVDGVCIEVLDGEDVRRTSAIPHCTVLRFGTDDVFKRDVTAEPMTIYHRQSSAMTLPSSCRKEEAVQAVLAAGEGIIAKAAVEEEAVPLPLLR